MAGLDLSGIDGLKAGALAVVAAVILLSIGSQIVTKIQKDQLITNENQKNNETLNGATILVNVSRAFANNRVDRVVEIYNITTRMVGVNFTLYNKTSGTSAIAFNDQAFENQSLNVTYIYLTDAFPTQYNVSGKGLEAFKTYGDYFTLIVLVLISTAIIVIVIKTLGKREVA